MTAANVTDPAAAAAAAAVFPPTIGDPNVDNSVQPTAPQQTPEQQRIAALEAQLAADRAAAAERENRLMQSLDTLMTRSAVPPAEPAAPAAPAAFSLDDLPDAVQAPTEFKTKLAEKVNGYVASTMQSAQQQLMGQVTRAQALDAMWNRMNANPANAEYVKRPALVQGAAALTFNELRARGIDPVALAAQNPDSLIGAIVTRMQAELGTAAPVTPVQGASGARAATVAGGSGPTTPTNPAPPKVPSFIEQHQAVRRSLGLV